MQAIYNQGPVVVAVDANDWFDYDQGVFDGCKKDATLGHAVLAKGYGGEGNGKYWRIQNSWGANWGEQGHIRLKREDSAVEEARCGQDRKPQEGLGCDGGPPEITVCGMCGILFDPIYPEGVTLEDSSAAIAAPAQTASFRGYDSFKPSESFAPSEDKDDFAMPARWSSKVDSDDSERLSSSSDDMKEERQSAFSRPSASKPEIFRPSESADKVKSEMEKNAVNQMEDMLLRGKI